MTPPNAFSSGSKLSFSKTSKSKKISIPSWACCPMSVIQHLQGLQVVKPACILYCEMLSWRKEERKKEGSIHSKNPVILLCVSKKCLFPHLNDHISNTPGKSPPLHVSVEQAIVTKLMYKFLRFIKTSLLVSHSKTVLKCNYKFCFHKAPTFWLQLMVT